MSGRSADSLESLPWLTTTTTPPTAPRCSAFVDETPAPQAPGSVNTYGASGSRTGKVAAIAVAVLVVVGAVIWLAVK